MRRNRTTDHVNAAKLDAKCMKKSDKLHTLANYLAIYNSNIGIAASLDYLVNEIVVHNGDMSCYENVHRRLTGLVYDLMDD